MKQASVVVASGLSSRLMCWTLTKGYRFAVGLRKLFFKRQSRARNKSMKDAGDKKMKEQVEQMKKKYFKRANPCALRKMAMLRCLGKRAGLKEKLWVWKIQGSKKDIKLPFNPLQGVQSIELI